MVLNIWRAFETLVNLLTTQGTAMLHGVPATAPYDRLRQTNRALPLAASGTLSGQMNVHPKPGRQTILAHLGALHVRGRYRRRQV